MRYANYSRDLGAEVRMLGRDYELTNTRFNYQVVRFKIEMPTGWNKDVIEVKVEIPSDYPFSPPKLKIPKDLRFRGLEVEEKGVPDRDGWCWYRVGKWSDNYTLLTWMNKAVGPKLHSPTPMTTM